MYIFDGAMGTMLQAAGLEEGYCPELFNVEKPEVVKNIHAQYYNTAVMLSLQIHSVLVVLN